MHDHHAVHENEHVDQEPEQIGSGHRQDAGTGPSFPGIVPLKSLHRNVRFDLLHDLRQVPDIVRFEFPLFDNPAQLRLQIVFNVERQGFFRIETDIPGIGQNVLTDNQVVVPVSRCAELVFGQVGRRQLQQRAALQLRGDPTAAVEHQDLQLPASADLVQQYRRHHQDDHQQRRQHGRQDKRPFPHPLVEFATDNQSYLTHGRFVQVVR